MWQLGWMISLIPDALFIWITYIIMILGLGLYVASKLVSWLPMINKYKLPFEIIGVVLIALGSYLYGSHGTEMVWREKVKSAEELVKVAEEKSKEATGKIQVKIVEKIKVVKDTQYVIQETIKEVEKKIDAECKVAPEAIDILNSAALNKLPGETK